MIQDPGIDMPRFNAKQPVFENFNPLWPVRQLKTTNCCQGDIRRL